ncbi:thermonuclease family protein [Afifella marina]|uniref:Nuclease homologue n=1 Tax=Afifella marina DSM 2698 TaxID=1120955 RepID=A0A1G5MF76_AFIMA|nr:thermonuclease family protein [Afifella marina]SCZ23815.1 nuclease homologue [Afifella marina DSM 2698]
MRNGLIFLFVMVSSALAGEVPPPAHDGDTFYVAPAADTPFCSRLRWGRWESIRILGIDAPEMHGRCELENRLARVARERLRELLGSGQLVLDRRGCDRYERTLARVSVGGHDIAEVMISEGLARPYSGGRRRSWCGR